MTATNYRVNVNVKGTLILRVDGDKKRDDGTYPEIVLGEVEIPVEFVVVTQ